MAESRCDTCDTGMKQGTWDRGCPSAKGPGVTGSRRGEEQMKKSPYLQHKSSSEKIDVSFCVYRVQRCSVHFVRFRVALLADKHSNPEGEGPSYNNVIID